MQVLKILDTFEAKISGSAISYFMPPSQQADESLNFEEQILEAAKSITAAAGALVKAATAAQRELVVTGRVCSVALKVELCNGVCNISGCGVFS